MGAMHGVNTYTFLALEFCFILSSPGFQSDFFIGSGEVSASMVDLSYQRRTARKFKNHVFGESRSCDCQTPAEFPTYNITNELVL